MKRLFFFFALALLSIRVPAQSLEKPRAIVEGDTRNRALGNAVEGCLSRLFPVEQSPEQRLVYQKIVANASAFVLKEKIVGENGKHRGPVLLDLPKVLDAIVGEEIVKKAFQGQSIFFVCEEKLARPEGFFADRGFKVGTLSPREKEELTLIQARKDDRKALVRFLEKIRGDFLVRWTFTSTGADIEAHNANGRLLAHFTIPFDWDPFLLKAYDAQSLVCFLLLEKALQQALKWRVCDEFFLTLSHFPDRIELHRLLQEVKGLEILTPPSGDKIFVQCDISFPKEIDALSSLQKQLSLRWASFFWAVECENSLRRIEFSRRFEYGRVLALTLFSAMLIALIGTILWRRTKRPPQTGKEGTQPFPAPPPQKPLSQDSGALPVSEGEVFENEIEEEESGPFGDDTKLESRETETDIQMKGTKAKAKRMNIGQNSASPSPLRLKIEGCELTAEGDMNIGQNGPE